MNEKIELSGIKKADLSVIVKWRNNPDNLKFNTQYFLLNMEHLKKTKPRILNSISSKITNKIFKIRGFKESKIINEWNEIVGEEISDLTLPIGITKDQKL